MKFFSVMYQTSNSKGQELLAQRMVKWALKLGHEAWLVTSIYHDGEEVIDSSDAELEERGFLVFDKDPRIKLPTIRVKSTKVSWPPRRVFFRDFLEVLRALDSQFDVDFIVVHSTLWNGPEEVAKWILWKKLLAGMGKHVSKTVLGFMPHYQPPDPVRYSPVERAFRMAWNLAAFNAIFMASDIVLCLTDFECMDMVTMGARPEQIHLFPGGLDDDEAALIDSIDPKLFRDTFGIPEDKLIVAYLGTIEYRKNPLAVVKIAKKLRRLQDVVFVIAGGPGDQWEDVVREAKGLDNVIITGKLSVKLKASLIKASYLNISMSRLEAFGLTQLEFMYGGVPVVTSASRGHKWLIRNGVDGIHVCGPDDIEGAAKAIEMLIKDRSMRDEMGRNARKRAQQFLMSKLMKSLLDRAEKLLDTQINNLSASTTSKLPTPRSSVVDEAT